MIRPKTSLLLTLALLFAAVPASAQDRGEVQVDAIEAASGVTSGNLASLLIDHDTPDLPVAAPGFNLHGFDIAVTASHVEAKVRTTSTPATPRTVQEGGPASIQGVESRPELHYWITPLDGGAAIEVQHRACTMLQPPANAEETRRPALNGASNQLTLDARRTAQVTSCTDAVAIIEGDFSIVAWEWDMTLNGERVNSGVNDTARNNGLLATGVGSADELYITARDATLRIPLTAQTYELYIAHPRLEARELHLTNAEGTLPGILEPLQGVDVELVGDYAVTLDASASPFKATVAGTTTEARSGDSVLVVQVPSASETGAGWLSWVLLAGFAVVGVGWNQYRAPVRALRNHPNAPLDRLPETRRDARSAGLCVMAEADIAHGRPVRAGRRATRAERLDPDNARAPFVLGLALHLRERVAEARAAYRRSQEGAHTPKLQCYAFMAEAELMAANGNEAEAKRLLHRARVVDAAHAAVLAATTFWDRFDYGGLVATVRGGVPVGSNTDYHF